MANSKSKFDFASLAGDIGLKVGGSLFDSALGNFNSKHLFDYQQQRQEKFQKQMLLQSPMLNASGLKSAGYNINFTDGSTGSAPAVPSITPSGKDSHMGLADFLSMQNMSAQNSLIKEQSRALRIENERKEDEDNHYKGNMYEVDGILYPESEFMQLPEEVRSDVDRVIPLGSGLFKNKGGFDSYMATKRALAEQHELRGNTLKNQLQQFIYDNQLQNDEVLNALISKPAFEIRELFQRVKESIARTKVSISQDLLNGALKDKAISEKDLNELSLQMEQDNNIMPYINKMFDGEFEAKDFLKMVVLFLAKGVGLNFSRTTKFGKFNLGTK